MKPSIPTSGRSILSLAVASTMLAGFAAMAPEPETCPSQSQVQEAVQRIAAKEPLPNPPASMTIDGALCGRDKLVAQLTKVQGPVVGYKAGLTNPAVQQRFNYPKPVRGTLLQGMILQDGAEVPAKFAARPVFEADLVVRVKSPAIHDAKTPAEVLAQIDAIYPFIELPDLVVLDPTKINGPTLAYINVGARYGVLGKPIPVSGQPGLLDALKTMTVRLSDGSGKELDRGVGSAILEHPLNAVVWLAGDLRASGITLKAGDLLSLGSFSKLLPPQPGQKVQASYEGLPGNPTVSVVFR